MSKPLNYKDAGVDIDAGDELVRRIKPLAARTRRAGVLAGIGGFGSLFEMPAGYRQPVLVSGTDGVGTKLRVAIELNRHDSVGIDLVAMSVNDIIVQGAEPLYFLDYFACGKLDIDVAASVVSGIATGCEYAGCALIGGETAEMPGMYPPGDYDLAGFAVGVVEKEAIVDGSDIQAGDRLLGLASSGAHANGYSLIRRIVERSLGGFDPATLAFDLDGTPFAERLLAPTRIYATALAAVREVAPINGAAHITGGGIIENLPRVLRTGLSARVDPESWPRPALFQWLQAEGQVDPLEMLRVFNCGIGMVLVIPQNRAEAAMAAAREAGETAFWIGEIVANGGAEPEVTLGA